MLWETWCQESAVSKTFYIAIEGVIGVGKTTLARLLQPEFDAELLLEVVEENPFLSDFYQDKAKYAFQTQIFFLLSRYRQLQQAASTVLAHANLISDYMLAKDIVFAGLTLNPDELDMHRRLYPILSEKVPLPDLVVFLQADTDVALQRIAHRDRTFERGMSRQYIDDLRRAYEAFFAHYDTTPVLSIDTNNIDFVKSANDLQAIIGQIKAALELGARQKPLL